MYSVRPLRFILCLDEMGRNWFSCLDAIRYGTCRTLILYCNAGFSKGFNIHVDLYFSLSCDDQNVNDGSSPQCITTKSNMFSFSSEVEVFVKWKRKRGKHSFHVFLNLFSRRRTNISWNCNRIQLHELLLQS